MPKLHRICERAVKSNADLIILTGDYLTFESAYGSSDVLEVALAPLKRARGRVFACLGNHDYDQNCMDIVKRGLYKNHIQLLVDDGTIATLANGRKVQIIATRHHFVKGSSRAAAIQQTLKVPFLRML